MRRIDTTRGNTSNISSRTVAKYDENNPYLLYISSRLHTRFFFFYHRPCPFDSVVRIQRKRNCHLVLFNFFLGKCGSVAKHSFGAIKIFSSFRHPNGIHCYQRFFFQTQGFPGLLSGPGKQKWMNNLLSIHAKSNTRENATISWTFCNFGEFS